MLGGRIRCIRLLLLGLFLLVLPLGLDFRNGDTLVDDDRIWLRRIRLRFGRRRLCL